MATLARALDELIADWSDALADSLDDASEEAVALCFEVGEKITAFQVATGEANAGGVAAPREEGDVGTPFMTAFACRLAAVVGAIPDGSPSMHSLKSQGYALLSRVHAALALLEPEREEETADLDRYDAFPEDMRDDIPDVPGPALGGGAGSLAGPLAVLFRDFDFPTAEPLLIAPREITYTTPAETLSRFLANRLPFAGREPLEFYTKREDAEAGTDPLTAAQLVELLMRLPPNAAVSCTFKRAADAGYFSEVVDHTMASGPVTYRIFSAGRWDHAYTLKQLQYIGAAHIDMCFLYQFYTSLSKDNPLPRKWIPTFSPAQYGISESGKLPDAPLHLFIEPPSAKPLGTIFVKTLTGKTLTIEIPLADTSIWQLKRRIQETDGVPAGEQRLIFAGAQLSDGASCAEYGVAPESTIHLVLRLSGD